MIMMSNTSLLYIVRRKISSPVLESVLLRRFGCQEVVYFLSSDAPIAAMGLVNKSCGNDQSPAISPYTSQFHTRSRRTETLYRHYPLTTQRSVPLLFLPIPQICIHRPRETRLLALLTRLLGRQNLDQRHEHIRANCRQDVPPPMQLEEDSSGQAHRPLHSGQVTTEVLIDIPQRVSDGRANCNNFPSALSCSSICP